MSGEGARQVGGRWNSPGTSIVYASESLALCLAECLVHLPGPLPADYVAFRIAVPPDSIEALDAGALKSEWREDIGYTRAIGDEWVRQSRSLALAVPSAVLLESMNILINTAHPRSRELVVEDAGPFRFDPRLRPGS